MLHHAETCLLQRNRLPSAAKVLKVDDLPLFLHSADCERMQLQIAAYLRDITAFYGSGARQCFLLPSLKSLVWLFGVSQTEIRQAFRELRQDGYDSFIPGLYGHISLWTKGCQNQ